MTLACLLLAGCAGTPRTEEIPATKPFISSVEARQRIVAGRSQLWKDPHSIRDAVVGEPYACVSDHLATTTTNPVTQIIPGGALLDPGFKFVKSGASCVCVELNAKNSYGGYTGIRRSIVVFPETGPLEMLDGGIKGFQEHCEGLHPFPELNAGK